MASHLRTTGCHTARPT